MLFQRWFSKHFDLSPAEVERDELCVRHELEERVMSEFEAAMRDAGARHKRELERLSSIEPCARVSGKVPTGLPAELAEIARREEATEQELERVQRARFHRMFGAAAAHTVTKDNAASWVHEMLFAEEAAERVGLRKSDLVNPRLQRPDEELARRLDNSHSEYWVVAVEGLEERRPSVQEEDKARLFLQRSGAGAAAAAAPAARSAPSALSARPARCARPVRSRHSQHGRGSFGGLDDFDDDYDAFDYDPYDYDDFDDFDDFDDDDDRRSDAVGEVEAEVVMVLGDSVVLGLRRALPAGAVVERIRFEPPGGTFPVLHEAIDAVGPLLFTGRLMLPVPPLRRWFAVPPLPAGVAVGLNPEQRQAAERLLDRARPRLAILEGPPGTGKSRVMCDVIAHLARSLRGELDGSSRAIVVCAHTNSVCDYLVEQLAQRGLRPGELLRISSAGRAVKNVPPTVREFSLVGYVGRARGKPKHLAPDRKNVMSALVVVATFTAAGRLVGPTSLVASHLFVDEAGQATEADLCPALALLDNDTQRVVLAGDPRQLGPVVLSPAAKQYGFGRSALQRLMDDDAVRARCSVMLKECYRCHPMILALFNLFYHGQLRSPRRGGMWEHTLPRPRLRVQLINAHHGREQRSNASPSLFNWHEIDIVVCKVHGLMRQGVAAKDIAIVSPYKEHAKRLRTELHHRVGRHLSAGDKAPDVGTVETMQGREAKVVIVTLCRTELIGFLDERSRANVAVSRAIDQLIIVCKHELFLNRDSPWNAVMKQAMNDGARPEMWEKKRRN